MIFWVKIGGKKKAQTAGTSKQLLAFERYAVKNGAIFKIPYPNFFPPYSIVQCIFWVRFYSFFAKLGENKVAAKKAIICFVL